MTGGRRPRSVWGGDILTVGRRYFSLWDKQSLWWCSEMSSDLMTATSVWDGMPRLNGS